MPWRGESWPSTTLPAFEAAWCAALQDESLFLEYDLRIRRAFFAESRDIGRADVLLEIAQEAGLDVVRLIYSGQGRMPGTAWHYPMALASVFPRALSDNLMLVSRKHRA